MNYTVFRLLTLFCLLAGGACTYNPAFDVTCDDEGARDGDRICEDGVWVPDDLPDSGSDAGPPDSGSDAADGGCTGTDCLADVDPDAPCDPESNADFCARLEFDCGEVSAPDNCGMERTVLCGSCDSPETCGGAGEPNVCGCQPETDEVFCDRLIKTCDEVTALDNCEQQRTVDCGTCTEPAECGGGGTDNVCACPDQSDDAFCDEYGAVCGSLTAEDDCEQMRTTSCGMCDAPETCGGAGQGNQCGCPDDAMVCMTLGAECGTVDVTGQCSNKDMVDCGGCRENASCDDPTNSCVCDDGFQPDGLGNCEDVDECDDGTDDCDTNATCTNTPGAFECECDSGYMGDGTNCSDIDECGDGTDDCDTNAICTNTPGGFDCDCDEGWMGNGVTCDDVNECQNGTDGCDANATCMNTPGGYDCMCNMGYTGDGMTCTPVPTDPIVSVQTVTVTMSNGESSKSSPTFPQAIDSANAVPFISLRTSATRIRDMTIDVVLADDKVDVSRDQSDGSVTLVVTVVEFDPGEVSVQTDSFGGTGSKMLDSSVDPTQAFATFAYNITSNQIDRNDLMISGKLTANSIDLGRQGNNGSVGGNYWVAEATNGAFSVQHVSGSMGGSDDTEMIAIDTVDPTKTFIIYSYRSTEPGDDGNDGQVSCELAGASRVECTRERAQNTITDLEVQVVELSVGQTARGTNTLTGTDTTTTSSLAKSFDTARSMAWLGQTGAHGACRTEESDGDGMPSGFATVELTGAQEVTLERDAAADDGIRCTWEAVEW